MSAFDNHLDELFQTVNGADLNHQIWWIFMSERPRYAETMNRYLGFFRPSIHAHFVAFTVALYRLGDTRTDSSSVRALLKEAAREPGFDPHVLDAATSRLGSLEPSWSKLKKIRHKAIAHRDRQIAYDEVFKSAAMVYDEIPYLIDGFFQLLNEILQYRSRTTWTRNEDAAAATHALFAALMRSPY